MGKIIPIVIPAYEPDDRLIGLMDNLVSAGLSTIVVVNDGSDKETYGHIFDEVKNKGAIVLEHEVNRGKGRALKTAFEYCLGEFEDMLGVITADSDGQHTAPDIKKCMDALRQDPKSLVLGVRNFDESGIPARSVFGNKTTSRVMKVLVGLSISDTQTGLRGISSEFMRYLLTEKGDRFEFETNMLLATKSLGIKIVEVPISTIYLEENKSSHFNPIVDSVRIYAIFFKFLFSSLSSSVVDIALFTIFCGMMRGRSLPFDYIMLATIMARVISAVYNFLINYKVVFKSRTNGLWAAVKYAVLAVCIMLLSGALVSFFHGLIPASPEFVVKIPVDCVLFLVSFLCQREIVYK
ncbi:glycosyltransferase [Butyrivibrio sp. VCB2001]|uniref:glycosyltransferase n=1 Tax=Butyrivibrio sp. VCB2001 TaxID=1280667 RepID=UPI0004021921|nr:glycosyltransferase [Butyrivibrio sp. VCB2001]